jgi:hypothetical protein
MAIVVLIATQESLFRLFIIVFLEKIEQIYMGEIHVQVHIEFQFICTKDL